VVGAASTKISDRHSDFPVGAGALHLNFPSPAHEQFFNDNGLAVKEEDTHAAKKRSTELKRKAAPKPEKAMPPKHHQLPAEAAMLPTSHQCPLEIASLFASNLAAAIAPLNTAGVLAPVDAAGVAAPMHAAGVVVTEGSLTPLFPFSNPSLSPTRQHRCTTPRTGFHCFGSHVSDDK
jgi:hypothetical protein